MKNKTGALAISQIFILIIGIVAISYAIGSEARIVSASLGDCEISFTYEGRTYTATGEMTLEDNKGQYYAKVGDRWFSSIDVYDVPIAGYIFNAQADAAVECWKEKNEGTASPVSSVAVTGCSDTTKYDIPSTITIGPDSSLWRHQGGGLWKCEGNCGSMTVFERNLCTFYSSTWITKAGGLCDSNKVFCVKKGSIIPGPLISSAPAPVDHIETEETGVEEKWAYCVESINKDKCKKYPCVLAADGFYNTEQECKEAQIKKIVDTTQCISDTKLKIFYENSNPEIIDCAEEGKICNGGICVIPVKGEQPKNIDTTICISDTKLKIIYEDGSQEIEDCAEEGKVCNGGICIESEKEPPKENDKIDATDVATIGIFGGLFNVTEHGTMHALYAGFKWAVVVYGSFQLVGGWLGLEQGLTDSLSLSASIGTFVWKGLETKGVEGALGYGLLATALIFALTYQKESQEIISFTCQPWDADAGGNKCNTCNDQGILPCSEYQCRSLGQACELVNKGTDKEKCVWIDRNDVKFPRIEALDDALLPDYEYTPDNSISPPDRGVKIEYKESTDKCVPAFTPLAFGIETNEPAKCKLDILRKDNFDDMSFYFSGGLLDTEHSYSLSLPGLAALEAEGIEIQNNGEYSVYVRCQDANENSNTANFVFNFCVDKGPDTTPPLIVGTSPLNDNPIAFGQTSFGIELYINEPAECRWSHIDQGYNDMTEMGCTKADTLLEDMNDQGLYTCITDLTGLKDRQSNKFYFRCKDQPGVDDKDRNINTESYKYTLIGTQPLVIDSVEPSDTIRDSTEVVKVILEAKTSAGYNQGESTCWYKEADEGDEDYIMFLETNSYQHSQELWLEGSTAGKDYDYSIKCCDLGNNCDNETASFSVETDVAAPIVVRAYKEETYLKITTNEPAECVYDVGYDSFPCDYNFEDGIPMSTMDDINHYTDWNTQTNFYIQCKDEYGKQPDYGECSIIVRPFEIY